MPGRRTSQTHDPRSPLDKERLSLTSQRFLSPLDTDPSYRLPRESAPSCGEPWGRRPHAAASRRGASWPDASRKGAVCGYHVAQNALFRYIAAREAWDATPRQPAGHYGEWPNWANALEQPPPARLRGGLRWDLQAPAWGLIARKGAVWAEGLADGAPWAKPRHHQAASCGLRRCRELRLSCNKMRTRHQDIIHQEDKLAIIGIVHCSLADLLGSPALPWVDDVQKPKCVHHRRRPSATRTLRRRHGGPTSSPCIASPRSIRQGRPRYPSRFSRPLRHCRCRRHAARSPPRSWG